MFDLRVVLRRLLRSPLSSAAIILTLGIGLGAATAIYSVAHALLLRPLPFPDADRIVFIDVEAGGGRGKLALREIRELEKEARVLERVGTYYLTQYNLTGGGPPEALTCTMPTASFFEVLGASPVAGAIWPNAIDFTRHYTVMLSHRLWQQRFGGDPGVVGTSILMDGASYQVAGVLPAHFDFPRQTDVYRGVTDYNAPQVRRYSALARVANGRTVADVQAELDALSTRFGETWPETNRGVRLRATPLRDAFIGSARPFVLLIAGGVVLLLVIATVNVGNLLLSRALAGQGDAAVRLALGAGRARLVSQTLVEAGILSLAGTLLGLAVAAACIAVLERTIGSALPPWLSITLDTRVLPASGMLGLLVALGVAVLPARQAARTGVEALLRQGTSRSSDGRQQFVRRWLVGAQAAIAAILLVAAGSFASGLHTLLGLDLGFTEERVTTFRVDPPFTRYGDIGRTSHFYRRAAEELALVPGVQSVSTTTNLPFARLDVASPRVLVEGQQAGRDDERPFVNFQLVSPGYFATMDIPFIAGRDFHHTDDEGSPAVAIISDRAARRFWSGDPVGRRIRIEWNQNGVGAGGGSEIWLTVIGVVSAVRFGGVNDEAGLDVYAPNTQMFAGDAFFVLKTAAKDHALERQIRAALDRVDSEQSFFDLRTLDERISATLWTHRVATDVLTFFAVVALVLAVIGTYAMTAHAVAAQRRELGIRLALGATGSGIGRLVLRTWLLPVASGLSLGVVAAGAMTRELGSELGVAAGVLGWPLVLPLLLGSCATAACVVPVARVLRTLSLTEALRHQAR
jgi:predicted permease